MVEMFTIKMDQQLFVYVTKGFKKIKNGAGGSFEAAPFEKKINKDFTMILASSLNCTFFEFSKRFMLDESCFFRFSFRPTLFFFP